MENKIIECIKDIDVFYKNKKIKFNSIDNIIINGINDTFIRTNNKNNLLIALEEEVTIIYLLLIIGVSTYYKNVKNSQNNILDILQIDDSVCYKREIYRFKGITNIKKVSYIKLVGKNEMITYVPTKNSYELTLYNGEATRINKSKILPENNRSNLAKLLVADIMNEDICTLNGVVEESNIIVIRGKEKILEIIQAIEINVNKQRVPFTELFCSAYWSSGDGEAYIIKNTIKEDILFNITNNTSVALDLITNDNKIKNVIVIGEKSYRDSLDTDLRRISFLETINNILIVDNWQSSDNYQYFMNKENEYEIMAINKNTILDNINLLNKSNCETESSVQKRLYQIANNLIDKKIRITYLQDSSYFNKCIEKLSKLLKQLCAYAEASDYTLQFIKLAYSVCNKLERTIIPFKYSEKNEYVIRLKIERLQEIKLNFHKTRSEYEIMNKIVEKISQLVDQLVYENKKFLGIKNISARKEKVLLIMKNKEELEVINKYLAINLVKNIKATLNYKEIDLNSYEVVIFTFYEENLSFIKSNNIKKLEILAYAREFYKYKWLINKNASLFKLIFGSCEIEFEYEVEKEDIEENIVEDDNNIRDILNKSFIRLMISKEDNQDNKHITNSKLVAKKLVLFKDGRYVFFSENYSCNCIDKREDDIYFKGINEIEIGDKLVFVKNDMNGRGDIIKDIIEKLRSYREFEDLYGQYFNKNMYWKNCLIKYMENNNLDEKDIANKFRVYGQTITALTISNWLNGNIIGPQNIENFKVIAEIVNDNKLKKEVDDIIVSCKQVRSIQIKVRKSIARMIIDSVISIDSSDNYIYKIINMAIGNFKDYAYVGEVDYVYDINKEIPTQFINKVNEEIEI